MIKVRAAARRWFWLVVLGALGGAIIGGASMSLSSDVEPDYEATSIVLLDLDRATTGAQQTAQQAGLRIRRGAVPVRAAELLERNDPDALARRVAVEVESDSLSLTIRAVAPDEQDALDLADAFTTAFLETSNQQELDRLDEQIELVESQLESARNRLVVFDQTNPGIAPLTDVGVPLVRERSELVREIAALDQQLEETLNRRDATAGPYDRLGPPIVAEAASGVVSLPRSPLPRIALLGLLGAALAVMMIALIERLNPRIDTKDEAEDALGLPVLTMVPFLGRRDRPDLETASPEHFGGSHGEAYRRLRSAVHFATNTQAGGDPTTNGASSPAPDGADPKGGSFLVVSASPGEGKTSTVAFTAFALAEADIPTVAVNADCRRPTLHRRLGVDSAPGLAEMAVPGRDTLHVDDVAQRGPIDGLWVVSSGEAGPLTSDVVDAVRETVDIAVERGATVVVDSSPLLATADVLELLPLVDHVIFVVRNGRTTRKEALDGLEMLRLRDAPVLGVVCVGSPATRRRYSYYESYYYHSRATPAGDDGSGEEHAAADDPDGPDAPAGPGPTTPPPYAPTAVTSGERT